MPQIMACRPMTLQSPTMSDEALPVVHMTTSAVRAELSSLVDRVEAGGIVIITKHGKPVAAMIPLSLLPKEFYV